MLDAGCRVRVLVRTLLAPAEVQVACGTIHQTCERIETSQSAHSALVRHITKLVLTARNCNVRMRTQARAQARAEQLDTRNRVPRRFAGKQRASLQVCRCTDARAGPTRRAVACAMAVLATTAPAHAAPDSSSKCYLDISVDGQGFGRVEIDVLDLTSTGGRRFLDLCKGVEGVGYRRSKFDAIYPDLYIRNMGVQALSYGETGCKIAGGESTSDLEREMDASTLRHDQPGVVSLQVRSAQPRVETTKLVADKGKFKQVVEQAGVVPNGTGFSITVAAAPELDSTNLVVGRVVSGMDVVRQLSEMPAVRDNSGSPFFKAGKAIGDKRANVAELGFNRPFNKIVVSSSRTAES